MSSDNGAEGSSDDSMKICWNGQEIYIPMPVSVFGLKVLLEERTQVPVHRQKILGLQPDLEETETITLSPATKKRKIIMIGTPVLQEVVSPGALDPSELPTVIDDLEDVDYDPLVRERA